MSGDEQKIEVKKCGLIMEVFSRVVGYFRPTSHWNKGKQEEFRMRKTFDLKKAMLEEQKDPPHIENCECCHVCTCKDEEKESENE